MLSLILLIFALVFACIAAYAHRYSPPAPRFVHWGWLAVAFYLGSVLVSSVPHISVGR